MSSVSTCDFSLDSIYECSNAQHGYPNNPSEANKIYEFIDIKPKPYKYDNCLPNTAPWEPKYKYSWSQCKGVIQSNPSGNFKIKGTVAGSTSKSVLKYWAANPSTCSYSTPAMGLPFPNEEIAYENTPNKGEVLLDASGKFEIVIKYPAGYYTGQGETYVPPHINFLICGSQEVVRIQLPFDAPFRSLGFNLANHSREFQPVPYKKPQ